MSLSTAPDGDLTDLQRRILRVAERNPDLGAADIAERADCSASYVRETLRRYHPGPYEKAML